MYVTLKLLCLVSPLHIIELYSGMEIEPFSEMCRLVQLYCHGLTSSIGPGATTVDCKVPDCWHSKKPKLTVNTINE